MHKKKNKIISNIDSNNYVMKNVCVHLNAGAQRPTRIHMVKECNESSSENEECLVDGMWRIE